ncbi:MAG: amidophosphoribosyltransferase [Deltaproteobacteria bacterium]|nr:amidophosphoribosyltransferase [Deltaproteobacteria bacterium]
MFIRRNTLDNHTGPREACGVFGVYGHPDAARLTYFGLYALQHRGQESAGISVSDGCEVKTYKGMGLVSEVFTHQHLESLKGHLAMGHVRYSTTGSSLFINCQPFVVHHAGLTLAIGHNGNLINTRELRSQLEKDGSIFQSTMDTEIIVHLMAKYLQEGFLNALVKALDKVKGAYSLVMMTKNSLIAARDPNGFRPLCLGQIDGGAYVVASETCALDLIEAKYIRDIEPGEIVVINENGLASYTPFDKVRSNICIFEFIYFARPDSNIFGQNVYRVRKRQGRALAEEYPMDVDFLMPFPDSGNYAALGFAQASNLPFEIGVIRNHYVGRTFIQPSQAMREYGVRIKLNPVKELIDGKRVLIIEDSIIRGTTTKTRVKGIREAGATEVHMLVSCPPHRFPCYYGIDFSTKGELIASKKSVDEIRDFLELDSLGYLSLDGLLRSTKMNREWFCLACFDGNYPLAVDKQFSKYEFEHNKGDSLI